MLTKGCATVNLKYKIYDKANKDWVKEPYFVTQQGNLAVKNSMFVDNDDFDFLIFTGLKDNKKTLDFPFGEDIYEGDIVLKAEHGIAVIIFEDGCFKYKWVNEPWRRLRGTEPVFNLHFCKKIGNKYDNPEFFKI